MDRKKFTVHLENSLRALIELTGLYCFNEIAADFKFIIEPNDRVPHAGMDAVETENLFVINRLAGKIISEEKAVELLCKGNKVPLWINMTIYESKKNLTVVHLLCSRRLREDGELNYKALKYPPFNILVNMPPDHLVIKDKKFDVNWENKNSLLAKLKQLFKH
jgi:hypothetical protein